MNLEQRTRRLLRNNPHIQTFHFPWGKIPDKITTMLSDVLDQEVDEKYFISNKMTVKWKDCFRPNTDQISTCIDKHYHIGPDHHGQRTLVQIGNVDTRGHNSIWGRVYDPKGIAVNLNSKGGGLGAKTGLYAMRWERTEKGKQARRESKDVLGKDYTPFSNGHRQLVPAKESVVGCVTGAINKDCLVGKDILTPETIGNSDSYANAKKTNPREILRVLWKTLDEETRKGWRFGEPPSLLTKEILQQRMYEAIIQKKVEGQSTTSRGKLSSTTINSNLSMREMWSYLKPRYSPQRQEQIEQLLRQFTGFMSELPHPRTLARKRNTNGNAQTQKTEQKGSLRIRKLTPLEAERLQGFPDGWTQQGMMKRGKLVEISDCQRYKMLGNAVTTTVISYLGQKILEAW